MRPITALALILAACAHKSPPPSVFPVEPPPLEPPELAQVDPAPDELPAVVAYVPGERAPFTDSACLVQARGVVLPESKAVELYQAAELGDWWEERARICMEGRATDRAYCDQVAGRQRQELEYATREARWVRWAIPAAVTVGIFLGVGAAELGDQVAGP